MNNRANKKRFLKQFSQNFTTPIQIISKYPDLLKKHLTKNSTVSITETLPTGKKTIKTIYWIEFPQDSMQLPNTDQLPVLILAQRGKSRIHELQSLAQLILDREKQIVLL